MNVVMHQALVEYLLLFLLSGKDKGVKYIYNIAIWTVIPFEVNRNIKGIVHPKMKILSLLFCHW